MKAKLLERLSTLKKALTLRAPCSYPPPSLSGSCDLMIVFIIFSCLGTQVTVCGDPRSQLFIIIIYLI